MPPLSQTSAVADRPTRSLALVQLLHHNASWCRVSRAAYRSPALRYYRTSIHTPCDRAHPGRTIGSRRSALWSGRRTLRGRGAAAARRIRAKAVVSCLHHRPVGNEPRNGTFSRRAVCSAHHASGQHQSRARLKLFLVDYAPFRSAYRSSPHIDLMQSIQTCPGLDHHSC